MANTIPYIEITRCCNSGETGTLLVSVDPATGGIGSLTPPLPGSEVFVYTGANQTLTDNNGNIVEFITGDCYTFTVTGNGFFGLTADLDYSVFTPVVDCQDAACSDCSPGFNKLVFTPCCEQYDTLEFRGDNYQDYLGIIIPIFYTGGLSNLQGQINQSLISVGSPSYIQNIEFGSCYTVTVVQDIPETEYNSLSAAPAYAEGITFTQVTTATSGLDCDSQAVVDACLGCPQFCYTVYDCDGNTFQVLSDINQYGVDDISNYIGEFVTLIDNDLGTPMAGTWYVGPSESCVNAVATISVDPVKPAPCDCKCYEIVSTGSSNVGSISPSIVPSGFKGQSGIGTGSGVGIVTYVDCNGNLVTNQMGPGKFCSSIYPSIGAVSPGASFIINQGSNCIDDECPIECFALVNCETQEVIYTESELYPYFLQNQIVTLNGYEGCWQVIDGSCLCVDIRVDGVYQTTAIFNGLVYNNQKVWEFEITAGPGGGAMETYAIWSNPVGVGGWYITKLSAVGDPSPPSSDTLAIVNSGIPDCPLLNPWPGSGRWPDGTATSSVRTLASTVCNIGCEDCPTNVTVLEVYDDCPECIGPIAYKLTSCDNAVDILYTTNDLSTHVDKVVELDNCGCYYVELITYNPPTDTDITITSSFDDCEKCKADYFELTDCEDSSRIIYTDTDLNAYKGKVIKISNCTGCWQVAATDTPGMIESVTFASEYIDCPDCLLADAKCECVKITNVSEDDTGQVEYYDCDDVFFSYKLPPGETTGKMCVKYVVPKEAYDNGIFYLEKFGDCQEGQCPQPVFKNNRKVKPGYNTPVLSADKYDKITCEFADIMYKKALEERYGISNCCPDELQNWILKKTLIDMQALRDPSFNCASKSSCSCGNTSICTTCNC
tara:strand:+ start:1258 stop:3918 length:2661 start_codon:yes stop_codon:yes gene_type:complete